MRFRWTNLQPFLVNRKSKVLVFERNDPMNYRELRNLNFLSYPRLTSILFVSLALIALASTGYAQKRRLSRSDLIQLKREILRTNDFSETDTCCDKDSNNIVYVVDADLLPSQLPVRKYIKFELITEKETKTRSKDGIEFYSFGAPSIRRSSVRIDLDRKYVGSDGGNGSTVIFTGRRTSMGWKVKGILGNADCSASGFAMSSSPN